MAPAPGFKNISRHFFLNRQPTINGNRHSLLFIRPKTVLWSLVGVLTCAAAYRASSDILTMTAFYPAPNAVYYTLLSTQNTYLNYCPQGQVCAQNPVGIRTKASRSGYALDVEGAGGAYVNGTLTASGGLQPGTEPSSACTNGMIAVVGGIPSFCKGSAWQQL